MGDGRYYTPEQFFSILYLTLIIVYMIVNIMLNIYKGSGNKMNKHILIPKTFLFVITVLCFIERVTVIEEKAFGIRMVMSILFILMNISFLHFNLHSILSIFYIKSKLVWIKLSVYTMLMGLGFSFFDITSLISTYSFTQLHYGKMYTILIFINLILFLWVTIDLLKAKEIESVEFNKRIYILFLAFLWVLPLGTYVWMLYFDLYNTLLIEYIMYLIFAICLNRIAWLVTPYRISGSLFGDVKNLMLDYIFITDLEGNVIYKNKAVLSADFFNHSNKVNILDLASLFNQPIEIRNTYKKQIVKYSNEDPVYFSSNKKELIDKGETSGLIITLTDITELILMLEELEEKQKEAQKANANLMHYKEIVYDIEKEKEINTLLNEIAKNQQRSMMALKSEMKHLAVSSDHIFSEKLSELLLIAKLDLQNVREAVTAYMNYYGGEND